MLSLIVVPAFRLSSVEMFVVGAWTSFLAVLVLQIQAEVRSGENLTPPYFNLAEGRKITASATCGVDTEQPELYCKLVGANAENDLDVNVIQGQYCDYCDPARPDKMHPPEFAADGMETWWQSPPLSRGMKYNEVNLTIDLGQEFHVAYVFIRMGNSPRPGVWVLEKSTDYGKTYLPWQYFADSLDDCETFFGRESLQPITRDDSVICTTEYSKVVPLEGGEIAISLLNNRPSANHYFNSTVLQEWTRATNVRLRLLRTKTFLGHLMSVARQDPTVTRRYFYSIKDISIGGRCMCNGHADTCDIQDSQDPSVLLCRCQHNTCGAKCDTCCPGFEQKKWQQSKVNHPFVCEPCNCFQHSNECAYDDEVDRKGLSLDIHGKYSGGGVCLNCQHNTDGINCNKCKPTFYRPYGKYENDTDACQPCNCNYFYSTGNCAQGTGQCECKKEFQPPNCDSCSFGYFGYPDCRPCECFLNGTKDLQCEARNGKCPCLYNYGGQYCKECAAGYYSFPDCKHCECNPEGSITNTCDQESGNCTCKNNFGGKHCDQCQDGYYNYPTCAYCNCDIKGTKDGICDKSTGQCFCKEGYAGDRCDSCLSGYYGYPDCKPCNCSKVGSIAHSCSATGKCSCSSNYAGKTCDQCSPGYYKYPDCLPCECDSHGSIGVSCDGEGKCECHHNFAGLRCDSCKEGFYNFPACEDCNCHPAGVVAGFAGCGSVPAGELCQCKDRVEGRICNKCRPLYWNLNPGNPQGCEECKCNIPGVLGGIAVCDAENGECACKPLVVARGCTECADGTYNLQEENLFGCSDCDCDVGGSVHNVCDKVSGQCLCHSRVNGRTCKEPLKTHYFPTLYQYQYEVEDGRTPANTKVRYANDERVFPEYSWKGYAVFGPLQKQILQDVIIYKPSLYRMVLRFVNKNPDTILGKIKITSDNPSDNEQEIQVQFRNSTIPAFVTVSGPTGNVPQPFVMNPGRWQISITVSKDLLLDYFVLLPEDFYLATILNKKVETPCTVDGPSLCRDYTYLNLTQFPTTYGVGGYVQESHRATKLREYFQDEEHLAKINVGNRVPVLNLAQPNVSFNVTVNKPGQYILVINYVTPKEDQRTHVIEATLQSGRHTNAGKTVLYSCQYTTLCRQVITTPDGIIAVQQVDGNEIKIDLRSSNADVGIHSIVAIPYEEWSLGYIKPKSVCIRKDGKCIPASFPYPPDTKKIQFAENNELATTLFNNTYMWLNPSYDTLDLKGKVPSPGYYTFIVHYYQPNFQDFDLTVLMQNGQFYEATLPVHYCPSISGCRSVITQPDGNTRFSLTENFMLTLKEPGNKNVYLDYLLVIPADFYTEKYLKEEDIDRTGEFISTCGSNHFNINTRSEGFCKDSVFSITAGHNSGALPCQCDYDGSLSFECDKFGGQCRCKPNIIGRKCEACKTGYFGFPDCKPCNCPSIAFCEPNTGQCICPPHVVGERCDQCEALTYGYDPIIGCEECKCNYLGIEGNQLQCDLTNGSCHCKPNVVGRQCDKCLAGHFAFPYCQSCSCDLRGTTNEICDQATAECFCKKNVVGPNCDFCREGSFNLQEANEDGCTECFCFGKTTRCTNSKLIRTSFIQMAEWQLVGLNFTNRLEIYPLNLTVQNAEENSIGVAFNSVDFKNTTVYFTAPNDYIGKKLTAYGGFLNYTLYYTITPGEGSAVSEPDVILEGKKTYLTYSSYEQPTAAIEYHASVQFVEENFELPTGLPARRDHIMEVLEDLRGIYIRATYWTASVTTRLSNVFQDDAVPIQYYIGDRNPLPFALTVEECRCPENYQGLSCEECAPGFYRVTGGPHGGYCVPCQCHGHAAECDVNTGVCLNCTHNTRGEHCELCAEGYHGNALAGTPMDCLICACPLPVGSNNFATACDVSSDGEKISCECKEGYFGARCQSCAAGYYGKPEVLDDFCKPCQCSGNINPEDPASCDTVSGECLRCLNNTFGKACALCAPGYFGDAVNLKDCQSCICDELGTDHCNSYTGECVCKPNVIGEKCDRCEVKHYGFQSGGGCVPCDCAEASDSSQCDDVTGQCRCKPGVSGRSCNRCSAGFWNYTVDGCVSCGCKSEYSLGFGCNALTGQCECLQGVIGEKCNQCPHRWVFVPDYGCHQCDSCTHALLDSTDELRHMIDPVIIEFDSANSGYFTQRKLDNMRDLLNELKPKFDDVDPKQSLDVYIEELQALEQDSKNLNRKANYSLENSESLGEESMDLKDQAELTLGDVQNAEDESLRVIDEIDKITFQLNKDENPEIDSALEEGQQLLEAIKRYNLTGREEIAENELDKVSMLLTNVTNFKIPVDYLEEKTDKVKENLRNFNDKLDDLYNQTQYSLNKANEAQRIIEKSGKERLKKKLDDIKHHTMESKNNLEISQTLNENSTKFINEAQELISDLRSKASDLDDLITDFKKTVDDDEAKIDEVQYLQPEVDRHTKNLTDRAMRLDHILNESKDVSGGAVRAANAYKDIVQGVKNASDAANKAKTDINKADEMLPDIENKTYDADQTSSKSLTDAFELYQSTNHDLKPKLDMAIEKYRPVSESHQKNKETLENLEKITEHIQKQSLDKAYALAADKADNAIQHVANIESIAESIKFDKLKNQTENATLLPKIVDDMNRDLLQTQKQLNTVNDKLPYIVETMDEIPEQQARLQRTVDNIANSMKKLNQQIILARDLANQIKIGMKFYPNTTLELEIPSNLEELSTSERISGYFRTEKPYGLLWYLGNPLGTKLRRTKSDDYMALIIQNGYPVLKLDVGNGVEQIINEKYVSDGAWYQFIVDRTGHNAKLTIREELPGGIENITAKETTLEGPLSIFNLDKNKSKLFVGSFPVNYAMQKEIDVNSFEGEIEDLVIGEKPVSLWNFNDGYENNHGAIERDKLVNLQPSTGFRFNGNGYAILNARSYGFRTRSDIQLAFKTFATEGLLFLAGQDKTFIALELRNGKVLYQYNLGHQTKVWHTTKTYNDGKWHVIEASREGAQGSFVVDKEEIPNTTTDIDGTVIDTIETVSFGGYPTRHRYIDVSQTRFDGCIDNVVIMGSPVDLRNNIKVYDVTPGCPVKFSQMVSFDKHRPGYVAHGGVAINNDFKISLKFKTKERDGLIFYATDKLHENNISLALRDGYLVLISQKIELISKDTFNDSQWHVVSIMHNDHELRIDFDDIDSRPLDTKPPPLFILHGTLYIGGLPRRIILSPGTVGSELPFKGCIGDLTLKGNVINFANSTDKFNENLGKCIYDKNYKSIDKIDKEPTLPPLEPIGGRTTEGYGDVTLYPLYEHTTIRGDGGRDSWNETVEEPITDIVLQPHAPITYSGIIGYPETTTPPPPRADSCALPLSPPQNSVGVYRFGAQKDSRLVIDKLRGRYKKQFDFALDFKSDASDGIIFYMCDNNETHSQYVAVYLQHGQVVYTYSDGSSTSVLKTTDGLKDYSDNAWHLLEFSKDEHQAKLVLDDEVVSDKAVSNVQKIDIRAPIYVGGLDPAHYNKIQSNLNITKSFSGCIRNVNMNSKPLEIQAQNQIGVVPCFDNIESGVFFPVTGGFVRIKEPRFKVGEVFNVKLDIKPRRDTGVLIAVNGKKDYFVLEMDRGEMVLTVENGKGPIRAVYNPNKKFYFCDGQWHSIQAVKSKNVITLSVDNVFTDPQLGDHSSTSTDTGSALFLGGHRYLHSPRAKGIRTKTPYVGCVKNIFINNEPIEILANMAEGDVIVGTCPTN